MTMEEKKMIMMLLMTKMKNNVMMLRRRKQDIGWPCPSSSRHIEGNSGRRAGDDGAVLTPVGRWRLNWPW